MQKNREYGKMGLFDPKTSKAEVPEMLLCSFSLLLGGIGVPKHKVIWQTQDPFFAPAFSFS